MSTTTYQTIEDITRELAPAPDQLLEFKAKEDIVREILKLQKEKNVLILGHNYMEPLVYHLSGTKARGDSLALSKFAAEADNPIIIFDGVRFMAETAKILNPNKKVLVPDYNAGCSLADPFTPADVEEYRKRHPGAPVITYINSYADIKAVSDYCCTSANVADVIEHAAKTFGTKEVIFFPDTLMGKNMQKELPHITIWYPGRDDTAFGRCEVHEKFTPDFIQTIRKQFNIEKGAADAAILVHWECSPEVVAEADFAGSTSQMAKYIATHPELKRVYLATECEMAANLAAEYPSVDFVRTCSIFCKHMKKITLEKVLYSLQHEVHEVTVPEDIRVKALKAIQRMFEVPLRH